MAPKPMLVQPPSPPAIPCRMHLTIHSITNDSPLLPASRTLFTEYAGFLRTLPSHACSIPNFDREIAALPAPYTPPAGELLLALIGSDPAACIAYRAATPEADLHRHHRRAQTPLRRPRLPRPRPRPLPRRRDPHPHRHPPLHPRHPGHRPRPHARCRRPLHRLRLPRVRLPPRAPSPSSKSPSL